VDHGRLPELQAVPGQYWDWVRRRRALREAARNAGEASQRDATTVENYLHERRAAAAATERFHDPADCSRATDNPRRARTAVGRRIEGPWGPQW
jgi:hypothetical protein